MRKTYPIFFSLFFIATSCSTRDKRYSPKPINVLIDTSSISFHQNIESSIENITLIPLQSTDDAILGDIQKVDRLGKKIVLLDKVQKNAIYIYNADGSVAKVLRYVDNRHIDDFIIEKDKILVYLELFKTIEIFDEFGKHVSSEVVHPDLLATSFVHLKDGTFVFWNNNASTALGNCKLLTFNDEHKFKKGYLPFPFELDKNTTPFNQKPFVSNDDGSVDISQPLSDTIWRITPQKGDLLFFPHYILSFQRSPLPPGFVNDPSHFDPLKTAENGDYSYFLGDFMNLDSCILFSYVFRHSDVSFMWNRISHKVVANAVQLGYGKWDIVLPQTLWQTGKNAAIGYYHSYDLTAWKKSHKNWKGETSILKVASRLTDLDNPVLTLIDFK